MSTYCPFVYHQIMVDFKGQASACCQFEASSPYKKYDEMMQQYRTDMDNGIQIKPCQRCWDDESNGFPSLRQSAIKDFKRYTNPNGIMILDVRLTNKCNLACIMCNEHSSSLWAKLKGNDTINILDQEIQDKLIANSKDLVKVSIQGGEPFYGDDFIKFIDRISNKENIELELFSNTITANINIVTRWATEFKHFRFVSSADGTEKIFEKIRWPAKWDKFNSKITQLVQIPHLELIFNFTVQNTNVSNIAEFVQWRNETAPHCAITFSILQEPQFLHFTNLDLDERLLALQKLENLKVTPKEQKIIDAIKSKLVRLERLELSRD